MKWIAWGRVPDAQKCYLRVALKKNSCCNEIKRPVVKNALLSLGTVGFSDFRAHAGRIPRMAALVKKQHTIALFTVLTIAPLALLLNVLIFVCPVCERETGATGWKRPCPIRSAPRVASCTLGCLSGTLPDIPRSGSPNGASGVSRTGLSLVQR